MRKAIEFVPGARFGLLTVVRRVPRKEAMEEGWSTAYWILACDCGNTVRQVSAMLLINGGRRSCGCTSKPGREAENIKGKRFGILTAESLCHKQPNGQGSHWVCLCDCGNRKVVRAKDLKNGNTASCGCLKPRRGPLRKPALEISRPWRKVDDRWLWLVGEAR